MSIASLEFLIFVVVAMVLYYILPLRYRWIALFFCSVRFLLIGNETKLIIVMGITITVTWLTGLILEKRKNKIILFVALFINIGVLIFLKEVNFFLGTARGIGILLHHPLKIQNLELVAPLGISYYTLNMISYLLDIYWGVGIAQKNYFKFVLFAGYFPILTSGPILRYRETEEALYEGHRFHYQTMCFAIQRILWGLFKKLVISERLAVIVNTIYGDYFTYSGFYIFIAILCFVFQLYTDFSGCIDIVLGVSELFGISLPENFQTPFFSRSVSEFWRRWHITLGEWLRDYILYPILKTSLWQDMGILLKKKFGKKYGKKIPVWLALFFSWLLIGFWHGGSWNYIIGVGLLMWGGIVLGELSEPIFALMIKKLRINTNCFSWKLFQMIRTFSFFAIGLSLFRSYGGFMEGVKIWKAMFSTFNPWIFIDGSLLQLGLDRKNMGVLFLSLLILGISGIMREYLKCPIREWIAKQNIVFRWILLYMLIFSILIFGQYGPGYEVQAFIYEAF